MKSSVRYVIFSLLFVICYLLFVIRPVYAQSINQTPQNSYTAPNTNPDVPKNLHTYSQNVLIEVMSAVTCQLAGVDPTNPSGKCLGVDPVTKKIGFVNGDGGAIGFMGNMITMLYTPPAHTTDYIRNLAQNFGITKPAYAFITRPWGFQPPSSAPPLTPQGTGFAGLSPLINLWAVFRNVVYLLFVIVFIVIGVAIMLRVKIDPRTVMTIQNQIPKIIMGILFITFSFAIAGFLIDLMYIFIYLIFAIFSGVPHVDISQLSPAKLQGGNPFNAIGGLGGVGSIANHSSSAVGNIISSLFDNKIGTVIAGILGTIIGAGAGSVIPVIGTIVGGIIGGIVGAASGSAALGFLGHLIAFIVIAIALLWALFRLWFVLITSYVMILIDVVFAPFWIIAGAFPGSTISFSSWLRDIVANLAAFPATIVMFLLGKVFMDAIGSSQHPFVPPLVGNPGDYKSFAALIGLGIILTTPNVVNMMKAALKAPKFDLSSPGQAIGGGAGYPISVGRGVGQTMVGRNEIIMRRNQAGQTEWGERGVGRAFFGRFFGRG